MVYCWGWAWAIQLRRLGTSLTAAFRDEAVLIQNISCLRGWWRLGEATLWCQRTKRLLRGRNQETDTLLRAGSAQETGAWARGPEESPLLLFTVALLTGPARATHSDLKTVGVRFPALFPPPPSPRLSPHRAPLLPSAA